MSDLYFVIVFFVIGLFFGSFYNVVGLRIPEKKSIVFPGSHCPNCGHNLKWYELIPVLSYLILGGKCKNCKKKISFIYPFIELITGVLFAFSYITFGMSVEFVYSLIFVSTLVIVTVSDLEYMIIPDEILVIGGVTLLIFNAYMYDLNHFLYAILGAVVSFGAMYLIKFLGDRLYKKETMGGGDIKLMAFIGLVLGLSMAIVNIFFASVIALPISLFLLIKKRTNILPFGPFISLGALILFLSNLNFQDILNILY